MKQNPHSQVSCSLVRKKIHAVATTQWANVLNGDMHKKTVRAGRKEREILESTNSQRGEKTWDFGKW